MRGLAKKFPQLVYVEPDYYADPLGDQNSTEDPLTQILEESARRASPSVAGANTSVTMSRTAAPMMMATMATAAAASIPGARPNDSFIGNEWAAQNTGQTLNGITGTAGADERSLAAWSVATGTNSVVVAVLDTGRIFASRSSDQPVEQPGRDWRLCGGNARLQRTHQRMRSDG